MSWGGKTVKSRAFSKLLLVIPEMDNKIAKTLKNWKTEYNGITAEVEKVTAKAALTSETKIGVFPPLNAVFDENKHTNTAQTPCPVKHDRGGVMIWACLAATAP